MSNVRKLERPATLADLAALPRSWQREIIDGTLHAFPHQSSREGKVEASVCADLSPLFDHSKEKWIVHIRPRIQHPRSLELCPNLAGWRHGRGGMPPDMSPITTVPDWVCEVVSPRTRSYDLHVKRPFYAEIGVRELWYVDFRARFLSVSVIRGGSWHEVGTWMPGDKVRAPPFETFELDIARWLGDGPLDKDD